MATNPPGRLIAYRADRLGARLVSLVNAMRLARTTNADFCCAWIETTGVGNVFNDPAELFAPEFVTRHFLSPAEWRRLRPDAVTLRSGGEQSLESVRATLSDGSNIVVGNAFGAIVLTGENEADARSDLRQQFHRIPFAEPVAWAMADADRVLKGYTAYHIRRGDLTGDLKAMNKPWPHKMVPDEFYEAHMRECLAASGGVVLFSDEPATIEHFRRVFPGVRVVSELLDIGGLSDAQRDLVELYAMGCCDTIIAPERSAFSAAAADLFDTVRLPVTLALDERQSDLAHETLMRRIKNDPGSFSGDGEIGQCLAHLGNWLENSGRRRDAANLHSDQVRRGLNISFVYPATLNYLHRIDDLPGVLDFASLLPERHIVHARDRVDTEILHGWGHIRSGNRKAGLRHVANGCWHGPASGLARSIMPLLVELGWFDHRNFLPVTPLQKAYQRRRGPVRVLMDGLPGLEQLQDIDLPESIAWLDPAVWDWAPLFRSVSTKAAARSGAIRQTMEHLHKLRPGAVPDADYVSQCAILEAFAGDTRLAVQQLETLGRERSGDWHVWQRLSHVCLMERRLQQAGEAASRALECLPDAPVLIAWAGMIGLRRRQWDSALNLLREADHADIGFPGITALLAEAENANGNHDLALATIRRARRFAPEDARMVMFEAELHERSGNLVAASNALESLVTYQRATSRVFVRFTALLARLGDTSRAAEVARIAQKRFPDHPGIAALGKDLAA